MGGWWWTSPAAGVHTDATGEPSDEQPTNETRNTTQHMKFNKKMFGVLAALALITAGAGTVLAAPGTVDGTQTDTADDTYISDGKTIDPTFNASGTETYNLTIQSVPDGTDLKMEVMVNGETYHTTTNHQDYADGDPDTDGTTTGEYFTFSDDDLSRVPMAVNENVTLNVSYYEQGDKANATYITAYIENTGERSVQDVNENASFVDVEDTSPPIYKAWQDDYSSVDVDDTVTVNGSKTDIIYTLSGDSVVDPFADVTDELSDAGAFTLMKASTDADSSETVPVFFDEKPDWYDEDDMGSYAVYDSDQDMVTFYTSEDNFDGENTADVEFTTDVYRVTDVYQVFNLAGGYSGSGIDAVLQMVM